MGDLLEAPAPVLPARTSSAPFGSLRPPASSASIIGELPSSIQGGLGGAILNFNQYYVLNPQNLWATNLMAAALGIAFFLVVVVAEKLIVHRPPEQLV